MSLTLRRHAAVFFPLAVMLLTSSPASGQSGKLEKEEISLTARDGWPIKATYYKGNGSQGKETPVIVLLHGEGGNRLVWAQGFAEKLQQNGFAAVAVDLRKHGESIPDGSAVEARRKKADLTPNDYEAMVALDLAAVKDFLFERHQEEELNMRKMGIVAADMSAPVALNFAVLDWLKKPYSDAPTLQASTPRGQDTRALVLLSPDGTVPGRLLPAMRCAQDLKNPLWGVALLICVSKNDRQDRGAAKKIHDSLTSDPRVKDRMYLQENNGRWRGTDILGKPGSNTEDLMLGFFRKHVMDLNSQWDKWRDRKSRLSN